MRRSNRNELFRPKQPKFKKSFDNTGDTFSAGYAARQWLSEHGFSYGSTDCSSYMPVVKGEYNLPQKLYNFSKTDQEQLAGVIYSADYRDGKVEVWLYAEFNESKASE